MSDCVTIAVIEPDGFQPISQHEAMGLPNRHGDRTKKDGTCGIASVGRTDPAQHRLCRPVEIQSVRLQALVSMFCDD
jgi:hypothetical protein